MSACVQPLFSMSHASPALPHPADILAGRWRSHLYKHTPAHQPPIVLPPIQDFALRVSPPSQPIPPRDPQTSPPARSPPCPPSTEPWYGTEASGAAVAEKTAEMVCYLWFSNSKDLLRGARAKRTRHSPIFTKSDSAAAALQFAPSSRFVQYVRKLLETTQVSQSVIVLSLHYIYRLRQQNNLTPAQEGSEFRVAVVSLMLANKFVDDNTYTNKTWSEVAGIELDELNRMEREFLMGVSSRLYVDKGTYESWLQLLRGLVLAKERDRSYLQTAIRRPGHTPRLAPRPEYHSPYQPQEHMRISRPRSSSPVHTKNHFPFTFQPDPTLAPRLPTTSDFDMNPEYEVPRPGGKRSAVSAFDSADVPRPAKRPIMLHTDVVSGLDGPRSADPAFSGVGTPTAQAFAALSISGHSNPSRHDVLQPPYQATPGDLGQQVPTTLAQSYHTTLQNPQPQNLYFYTLWGSPTTSYTDANRKAKLRFAPRHSPAAHDQRLVLPQAPLVVQSANTSPRDLTIRGRSAGMRNTGLPEFERRLFHAPRMVHPSPSPSPARSRLAAQPPITASASIPEAHFANAGPPGLYWSLSTPIASQQPHHLAPHPYRRF